MKLLLLALYPLVSQADYPGPFCFTGTIKVGNDTWTQDHVMAALEPQVTEAVVSVANADQNLASFLNQQGNCQADCLALTVRPAFVALYGKLGEEFVSTDEKHKHHDVFVDALCGAFRACYPHPPREEVRQVAEAIFHATFSGMDAPEASAGFPPGVQCPNEGYEAAFPLNDFLNSFHTTIMTAMAQKPKMQKLFNTEVKDCQKTCLQETVPASAMTLFLTNNYEPDTGVDALTGAIHACLPGWKHEDIAVLVSETADAMAIAEQEAAARRDSEYQQQYYNQRARLSDGLGGGLEDILGDYLGRYQSQGRNWQREGQAQRRRRAPKRKQAPEPMPEEEGKEIKPSEGFSFLSILGTIMAVSLALLIGVVLGRRRFGYGSEKFMGSYKSYQILPSTLGQKSNLHHV
eukprot:gnl/MRDRNA2_/MRDRNA2_102717_c0_seq1.p1 gnl/MRDRNA2_/MRDRNA2_102717_c0~~gnl/MRDRNA2_/MRDRNA2_102717_c0_seq1.p1  ORF type:complete len:405 (-),score=76.51 gnl/MRDRNA2_/MRDRNA2_102717_c0_seq1:213-1427(-)